MCMEGKCATTKRHINRIFQDCRLWRFRRPREPAPRRHDSRLLPTKRPAKKCSASGSLSLPTAAIVDYELTLSKPMRLTADPGGDSLTHTLAAYVSKLATPFTDGS